MNKDAFSWFHPVVNLTFFLMALGMTMFVLHPVYLLISFAGGCAYLLYLQGRKGFLRQVGYLVPILVLMAMTCQAVSSRELLWQKFCCKIPKYSCWTSLPRV